MGLLDGVYWEKEQGTIMNIDQEGEHLRKVYYIEYKNICDKLNEKPVVYDEFNLDIYHELKVRNLKK